MLVRATKTRLKYSGFMVTLDATNGSKITDCTRTTMGVKGIKFYCGRHIGRVMGLVKSIYLRYELSDLDGLAFTDQMNKMALRFADTEHVLYIVGDGLDHLVGLIRDIRIAVRRLGRTGNLDPEFTYDYYFRNYLSLDAFDAKSIQKDSLLSTLILEDLKITFVPGRPMNPTVMHLSLSRSTFIRCKDKFWDWVSSSGACKSIQILEMNSMKLDSLPFEIMYMPKLQILSVADNKLTHLPHYLGEFKHLDEFYCNNNMIRCLPRSLLDRTFHHINYKDNKYIENDYKPIYVDRRLRNDKKQAVMKLSHLSFLTLIHNRVKLSRDNVPSKLQHYFDQFGSCVFCHKLIFTEYTNERIEYFYAETYNIMCDYVFLLPWLSLECNYSCKRKWIKGERYRFHLKGNN